MLLEGIDVVALVSPDDVTESKFNEGGDACRWEVMDSSGGGGDHDDDVDSGSVPSSAEVVVAIAMMMEEKSVLSEHTLVRYRSNLLFSPSVRANSAEFSLALSSIPLITLFLTLSLLVASSAALTHSRFSKYLASHV